VSAQVHPRAEVARRLSDADRLSAHPVAARVLEMATDYTTKELMAAFVASEIHDDEIVSVGASLPVCRAGILLAHLTHAPSLKVQMSFTMTNLRNVEVLESFEYITDWRAARWAEYLYNHDAG